MRRIWNLTLSVGAAAILALGCGPKPNAQGVLRVTITLEPGATSRCAVLSANPATGTPGSTKPMPFNGQSSIEAGVYQGDMSPRVTLTVTGYSDDGCTSATVPAETDTVTSTFLSGQITDVAMSFKGQAQTDGGQDGGADGGVDGGVDGGQDAGPDAGPDNDNDGYPTSTDCDDSNAAIHPGATELCADGIDNNCDSGVDCADPSCNTLSCMVDGGLSAVCTAWVCAEVDCANLTDDDRDTLADCADPDCNLRACRNQGQCQSNSCDAGVETGLCNDGIDNDHDGFTDCADSDCVGSSCSADLCRPNDVCNAGGNCVLGAVTVCTTPPDLAQCHQSVGSCSGGQCSYAALDGGCNDTKFCTVADTCSNNGASCGGTVKLCTTPPFDSECLASSVSCDEADGGSCDYQVAVGGACDAGFSCQAGACSGAGSCTLTNLCTTPPAGQCWVQDAGVCSGAGCTYLPKLGTCDDGNTCTTGEQCQADSTCDGGTWTSCPNTDCKTWQNTCTVGGVCNYTLASAGTPCNSASGTCDSNGACVPSGSTFSFPYTVSNVDWTTLVGLVDGGVNFAPTCTDTVINTTPGAVSITGSNGTGCTVLPLPPTHDVTQPGGVQVLVFAVDSLLVTSGQNLAFTGSRPAVWVVFGDAGILGTISADAGADPTDCSAATSGTSDTANSDRSGGGGGGAFGLAGGDGGLPPGTFNGVVGKGGAATGTLTNVPLRGGCRGADGGSIAGAGRGGSAGGALQISVAGSLVLGGTLTAPGQGGAGATVNDLGGGGGGSGGAILLEAASMIFLGSARVTANGGAGGEGASNATAGVAGFAGYADAGQASFPTGGCGGDPGLGGALAGTALSGVGGTNGTGCRGGGGGGGSVGRIRLNAKDLCTSNPAGLIISPAHSSGGATVCP